MEDSKKITIADAFVIYTLLKDAFLGDMETSDKLHLIDTMSNFRKVVFEFEEFKRDVKEKVPEDKGDERIKMFTQKAAEKIGTQADVIINIQGDEPFIQKSQIETLMHLFDEPSTQIGTLGKRFESIEAAMNPNSPKIVTDKRGFALYFSRSIIPYVRGKEQSEWLQHFPYLKHLGLYAYRREVLQEVTQLPQSPLEIAESLEQLRWLENGYRIRVGLTDVETVGIDTPEDLQRAEEFLASRK
jgi:3-deoxy-D-manno-octulosonate cytidylyltransferase